MDIGLHPLLVRYSLTTDSRQHAYDYLTAPAKYFILTSFSINTVSNRASTNCRDSHRPDSHRNAQSEHRYQTTDRNTPIRRYTFTPNSTPDQRHEWYYANQQLRCDQIRRRPDDYMPFQSMFQPDGRHAYNPNGPHYPQQVYWGQGTSRDSSRMPNPNFFPRDTIRPMPLNHSMMQYGPGFASRSGPGNGGSGGGYGGGRR